MTHHKRLDAAAASVGINARNPQAIIQQATSSLRQLLDTGVPSSDPRCLALLQLANSVRLQVLPNSNDAAATLHDLPSRAMHIDISTATLSAAMGLQNSSSLTGTAFSLATAAISRGNHSSNPPSSGGLRLRLLPRLSQAAVDATFGLVATDEQLGIRSKRDASVASMRPPRVRMSNRQSAVRKRRSVLPDALSIPAHPATPSALSTPGLLNFPSIASGPGPSGVNGTPFTPRSSRRQSVTFADEPTIVPPPPPFSDEIVPVVPPTPSASERFSRARPSTPNVSNSLHAWPRYRSRASPIEKRNRNLRSTIALEKGVMNDAVGTPDDFMEAFMHQPQAAAQPSAGQTDAQARIRAVLSERERVIVRLIRQRRAELQALPLGVSEPTRRKAVLELKRLSLLDRQRVVRHHVAAEMKKSLSSSVHQKQHVPDDNLSRLFRRRDPPIYSYMDGYPRITPFDDIPEMPQRHPATVAKDSVRMAEFDLSRMDARKEQRRNEYLEKLTQHTKNFTSFFSELTLAKARLCKNLDKYFVEKKRLEERKRKQERIERLKLLRSNDEQAYLKLLKNTKNERLLQLVRQTDNYLMQIGAQVEQQRDSIDRAIEPDTHNAFAEELGGKGDVPLEEMRRRRDLYYTVTHAVQEDIHQPSIMVHGTLKGYQLEGLKWMISLYNNNLNGILADEMGLGKTIQTISLITYLIDVKKNRGPYLIIVPLSTMGNWVRELNLWAPSLEKIEYRGTREVRRELQRKKIATGTFNVLLTTYEFTVQDQKILSPIQWQYIIIDEGHRMKNANCKLAMTLGVKYKSRNRLLLTGTPLQNNLTELWALLNFLLPNIFSSADTFETWFKQPFETKTLGDSAELEEEERLLVINRLHQVLRPFLLRRLKTDVEAQLPQKVEHVLRCDMSSWQRVLYRQITKRIGLATSAQKGSVKSFNNLLMQCKKVCNHPYLFYDSDSVEHLSPEYLIRASGKFYVLHHMLPKLQMHGHRTLIFSQMTAALDHLEMLLTSIGIGYLRLDGNTKSNSRQELLNMFNAPDSPYSAFLLSTRAGGLGLNLQTADTVIIFDSDWNPMMDLQAQDRAHRIGQKQVVRVYRLICSGTVEVKILDQANKKLQVDAQVIQAGKFNNKSTDRDRHEMLKDLLRQQNDDDDEVGDVPSLNELNRLIARTDEEVELFEKYDEDAIASGKFKTLLTTEADLPEWVLQPDVEHKTAEEKEQELLNSHGRGRRKRKATHDMDMLTEAEWVKVAEGEMTVEEAFERRQKRTETRRGGSNGRIVKKRSRHGSSNSLDDVDDAVIAEDSVDNNIRTTNPENQESNAEAGSGTLHMSLENGDAGVESGAGAEVETVTTENINLRSKPTAKSRPSKAGGLLGKRKNPPHFDDEWHKGEPYAGGNNKNARRPCTRELPIDNFAAADDVHVEHECGGAAQNAAATVPSSQPTENDGACEKRKPILLKLWLCPEGGRRQRVLGRNPKEKPLGKQTRLKDMDPSNHPERERSHIRSWKKARKVGGEEYGSAAGSEQQNSPTVVRLRVGGSTRRLGKRHRETENDGQVKRARIVDNENEGTVHGGSDNDDERVHLKIRIPLPDKRISKDSVGESRVDVVNSDRESRRARKNGVRNKHEIENGKAAHQSLNKKAKALDQEHRHDNGRVQNANFRCDSNGSHHGCKNRNGLASPEEYSRSAVTLAPGASSRVQTRSIPLRLRLRKE